MPAKFMDADAAARLIKSGDTITISGNVSQLCPDAVIAAVERRFLAEGEPRNLTEFHPVIVGRGADSGVDRLSHPGLIKRFIGSSYSIWGMDRMNAMIDDSRVEAYALPMGTAYHLLRAIANRAPGVLTEVGVGTFVDPRLEGGRLNTSSPESIVDMVSFAGKDYLFYPSFPINVALIQASSADEDGNLSVEDETTSLGIRIQAMAVKRCGGIVIAQVKRQVAKNTIHPRNVEVPGRLVDVVVVEPEQAQRLGAYDPVLTGQLKAPDSVVEALPMGIEKLILRRAAKEVRDGDLLNIGYGIAIQLPLVLHEEGMAGRATFTTEHGAIGGLAIDPVNFGAHINPTSIIDAPSMFDIYHAGGLDLTFLSQAQVDASGNVNVSRFGKMRPACGGFHDITAYTKRLVFVGSFTTKGLRVSADGGTLRIEQEGAVKKFVPEVEQITLNGRLAAKTGQEVLYVTERAVFRLTERGPVLTEVAPGISIDRDIRPNMGFELLLADNVRTMDGRIFSDVPTARHEHGTN